MLTHDDARRDDDGVQVDLPVATVYVLEDEVDGKEEQQDSEGTDDPSEGVRQRAGFRPSVPHANTPDDAHRRERQHHDDARAGHQELREVAEAAFAYTGCSQAGELRREGECSVCGQVEEEDKNHQRRRQQQPRPVPPELEGPRTNLAASQIGGFLSENSSSSRAEDPGERARECDTEHTFGGFGVARERAEVERSQNDRCSENAERQPHGDLSFGLVTKREDADRRSDEEGYDEFHYVGVLSEQLVVVIEQTLSFVLS